MTIVKCPKCGAKNRVEEGAAKEKQPLCGRCGAKLNVSKSNGPRPTKVTDATFGQVLRDAGDKPVLIDCWAPWCGPCKMIAPIIDQLASESDGRWVIAKMNTDENQKTASRFNIDAIPTMLIFRDGRKVDQIVGMQPKQSIERRLAAHVD